MVDGGLAIGDPVEDYVFPGQSMQRTGNGCEVLHCYAPKEIYKSNKLANVVYNSSEGLSTPVTSSLMPSKPART